MHEALTNLEKQRALAEAQRLRKLADRAHSETIRRDILARAEELERKAGA